MSKLLIVEDDRSLAANVKEWLEFEHHLVEHVENGLSGLELMQAYTYDLIILDMNLPKMDGVNVCREYRSKGGQSPILMLTGRDGISDKEAGFMAGVDDYLTKPFHMKELSMRIRAILKRPRAVSGDVLKVGDLVLDLVAHEVSRSGDKIHLPRMEFLLLEFLMRHPDQVFSPENLLESVWKSESERTADSIRTSIKKIRQQIDRDGKGSIIKNVHGVGYKLEPQ